MYKSIAIVNLLSMLVMGLSIGVAYTKGRKAELASMKVDNLIGSIKENLGSIEEIIGSSKNDSLSKDELLQIRELLLQIQDRSLSENWQLPPNLESLINYQEREVTTFIDRQLESSLPNLESFNPALSKHLLSRNIPIKYLSKSISITDLSDIDFIDSSISLIKEVLREKRMTHTDLVVFIAPESRSEVSLALINMNGLYGVHTLTKESDNLMNVILRLIVMYQRQLENKPDYLRLKDVLIGFPS